MDCEICGADLADATAEVYIDGGWVTVTLICPKCGTRYFRDVLLDNFDRED